MEGDGRVEGHALRVQVPMIDSPDDRTTESTLEHFTMPAGERFLFDLDDPTPALPPPKPAPASCPRCQSHREWEDVFCLECGFIFPNSTSSPNEPPPDPHSPIEKEPVRGRYKLLHLLGERDGIYRYRALDQGKDGGPGAGVTVLRQRRSESPAASDTETGFYPPRPAWPGVDWYQWILETCRHPCLPVVLEHFDDGGFGYLVVESPEGTALRDLWDDRSVPARERFGWLAQLAEGLPRLHDRGACFEALRPEILTVTPLGNCVVHDLGGLLPLPVPTSAALAGSLYAAPELVLNPAAADPRAGLYSFGAMLYSLTLGRELSEIDFTLSGVPRPLFDRIPDIHPLLGRLIAKTFCREAGQRFPTGGNRYDDPTGHQELARALRACQRTLDRVRLDIGAWSTTGMTRSGNEDALAVVHGMQAGEDEADESALIALADGMGGMEAGEIAAATAVDAARQFLLRHPPFAPYEPPLIGDALEETRLDLRNASDSAIIKRISPAWSLRPSEAAQAARTLHAHQERVESAMLFANSAVLQAVAQGVGESGMGCTLELLVIDGPNAVVGHVGDSRTYHLCRGHLHQITRDQTYVQTLIDGGEITPEEAADHPRRAELQQAVGGRAELHTDVYPVRLQPGDWLLVCSDGLTNQLPEETLAAVLRESPSAERAARRLVNLANLEGAADNVSVVVVRVC